MADNYIEKKMEEHRNGSRPAYRPKLTPRGSRPGELTVRFIPCTVYIPDATHPILREAVGELAAAGFKVSFSLSGADEENHRKGNIMAQHTGARFIPAGAARPDTILLIRENDGKIEIGHDGSGGLRVSAFPFGDILDAGVKSVVWSAVMVANFNRFQENMLGNIKIEGFSL